MAGARQLESAPVAGGGDAAGSVRPGSSAGGWRYGLHRRFPETAINLLRIVLARIDDVQQRYLEICTEQVDRRIARSLLRLMRWKGVKQNNGILIEIPLSRQNIADYSGTTLYTVSRTLSGWEKKNWIKSGREKIIVTDPHALVAFAEAG